MIEKEVTILAKNAELSGTLCLPEELGVFPTVLMVHGSGNLDRNENTKQQKLNVFNTIAHHLAENGIASLCYDKRGVGKSTGDYYSAGHFDLVDDAMSCLEYLSENKYCDSDALFLLGHSEGSIIVPQMSQRHIAVSGLIMLTPFIDKMESILLKQAVGLEESIKQVKGVKSIFFKLMSSLLSPTKVQKKLINKVKNTSRDTIYLMLQKTPAKWFRELFTLNPPEIYKNTRCASIIIGGSKDIQCDPNDVAGITRMINGPVESYMIEDMTHILRKDFNKPSLFNYAKLMKQPIEPKVLELITQWINKTLKL